MSRTDPPLAFEEGAARALMAVLDSASDEAGRQSGHADRAIATALVDFSGGYERVFTDIGVMARDELRGLAFTMMGLVDRLRFVLQQAEQERERRARLSAWERRDAERARDRAANPLLGEVLYSGWTDPMPTDEPVIPPVVTAEFWPCGRYRVVSFGGCSPRSSADPDRLREYSSWAAGARRALEFVQQDVGHAWAQFRETCGWVRIGDDSLVRGIYALAVELNDDALWIGGVADAFDHAGGGGPIGGGGRAWLSIEALNLATPSGLPLTATGLLNAVADLSAEELDAMAAANPVLRTRLANMDPATVNAWWTAMDPDDPGALFSDRQRAALELLPAFFGNLEGIPYTARDHANRIALDSEIAELTAAIAAADVAGQGIVHGAGPATRQQAHEKQDLDAMRTQLAALQNIRSALERPTPSHPQRFLMSLTDDRPPLAAVSIGDLDTATDVAFAVPGMGTTTAGMTDWTDSAQSLHDQFNDGRRGAVVAWIGYETPPVPLTGDGGWFNSEVFSTADARAGGAKLAASLRGLMAVRSDSMPGLDIIAHSYGTTTAAFALTDTAVRVDNFVMLGSAGLSDEIQHASQLHAEHVYAGNAQPVYPGLEEGQGDQWSWVGRSASADHHINPMDPAFGAVTFGTDTGGAAGRPVTDHAFHVEGEGEGDGYGNTGTESVRNVAHIFNNEPEKLTPYVQKPLTDLQRSLLDIERTVGGIGSVIVPGPHTPLIRRIADDFDEIARADDALREGVSDDR